MIGDDLYKRGYGQPLLKFVTAEQAQYIIKELHEGICGYHSDAHTMTPESFAPGTSGRPWTPTATILSKDAYPARNIATSSTKNRTASFYTIPVALHKVENGHSRPFLPGKRPSKIPDSSRRLLHQVDRSQTISHHYNPTSPTIRLEGYYMAVWRPTYNHHRQWPTVYRQKNLLNYIPA